MVSDHRSGEGAGSKLGASDDVTSPSTVSSPSFLSMGSPAAADSTDTDNETAVPFTGWSSVIGRPLIVAGRVTAIVGAPAAINSFGQFEDLQVGDPVFLGEGLLSGEAGRISVVLNDGSVLHLGPLSLVVLPYSKAATATFPMRIQLQGGEVVVVPAANVQALGAGVQLESWGGDIHGNGAFLAHYSASHGLEATLLPDPRDAATTLRVVTGNQSQELSHPFDFLAMHGGGGRAIHTEHLDCADSRLQLAAEFGLVGPTCGTSQEKSNDDLETSPGGDLSADVGLITVTQASDVFDLKPEAAPLADPTAVALVGASSRFSLRSHLSDLLLLGGEETSDLADGVTSGVGVASAYDFSLMRLWDPGRTWRGLGGHAEPIADLEVPLEKARIIVGRAGEMAELEASGALVGEIEQFLGLSSRSLERLVPTSHPTEGGAMRLEGSIPLEAGQTIWFDFFLDAADEDAGAGFNDFAAITISVQGRTIVVPIADESPAVAVHGGTGWQSLRYTAGTSGDYTFGFAVLNDGTGGVSRLYVDNVRFADTSGFPLVNLGSRGDSLGGSLQILAPKPIANPDVITVAANTTYAINVDIQLLANDRDPDVFDLRRISGIDPTGTYGTVKIESGKPIVYDPHGAFDYLAAGELGFDTFKYVLDGGNGQTAMATVTLRVVGVNEAPTAGTFTATGEATENGAAIVISDVVARADDVDSDDDNLTLKVLSATAGLGATVQLGGPRGQELTYNPSTTGAFDYLAVGETAQDVITYTVVDRHGATGTGQINVIVHGVNDLPVAADDTGAVSQDTAVSLTVTANDTDPDLSDRLEVAAVEGVFIAPGSPVRLASGAMVSLNDNGGLNYNPNGAFVSLAAGQTGSDSFSYRISDGHGGFADASVAVTIIGLNDAPYAAADARDIFEDGITSISIASLLANDRDPDQGDAFHFIDVSDQGSLVSARIDGDAIILDPADRYQYLAEGETATQVVRYTIADASGAAATGEIAVTIHGVNDAPVAVTNAVQTVEEHEGKIIRVLDNDHDVDLSDTLTITAVDGRDFADFDDRTVTLASGAQVTLQTDGTLAYDPTGAFTYLGFQERATETFTYTISDGYGATAQATVSIGISGVNDTPVAGNDAVGIITQSGVFTLNALANDHDPDLHDYLEIVQVNGQNVTFGNPLNLKNGETPTGDWVLVSAGGQLTYHAGTRFDSLGNGETASVTLTYSIRDTLDARADGSITFTVIGTNDAPVAIDDAGYGVDNNTVLVFPMTGGVLSNDHDPDRADTIHVAAVEGIPASVGHEITLASGALLTMNADGSFRYDPNGAFNWLKPEQTAKDTFKYTASDGHGGTATASVTVEVQGHPNEPPVALDDTATTDSDAAIRLHVLANDSDPENAQLQIIDIDDVDIDDAHKAFVRINPDGTLTYDPARSFDDLAAGETATDTFTYTIDDDLGGCTTAQVTVTIVGTGRATSAVKQTIVESFEQPFGSLIAGWGREPESVTDATAVRLISGSSGTGTLALYGPTHLGTAVLLQAQGVSAVGDSPLEAYLGLRESDPPGRRLPDDTGNFSHQAGDGSGAVSGSAIKTEIIFTAADLNADGKLFVSFDWNFISAETVTPSAPGANDYAIFTVLNGTNSRVLVLSDARTTGLGVSGWRTSIYDLTDVFGADITAGDALTLGFAVVNDQDNLRPSSLLLDNVRINAPTTADATLLRSDADGTFLTYVHAPTAVADVTGSSEDAPIIISPATLLANDTPSPGTKNISFVGLDDAVGSGAVSISGGQIIYNPGGKFDALAVGEVVSDTFHYLITDANGGIGHGDVTVQITGLNDAPTASTFTAGLAATEDGAPIGITDVLTHADDVDSDDNSASLRVVSVSAASGAEVLLSGDRNQNFNYDPTKTTAFNALGVGETTADSITYTIVDSHGATATGQVMVTVQGVNDVPTAIADALTVDEYHILDLAVLANDQDPDRNDTLKVVRINGQALSAGNPIALASGALVLLTTDGRLQFNPNGAYDHLPFGHTETASFTYTASDGHGGFADAVVALTITGLNDAPVAFFDTLTADEDHSATVNVSTLLVNDRDPDMADFLQVVAVQGTGASLSGAILTYDPGNRFAYLSAGQTATEHLTYTVADNHGATAQGAIDVIIEGRNDAPDAVADTATTREDQAVMIAPLANDTDPDVADKDHLTVLSIDTHGTLGTVTIKADGTLSYDPAGKFNYLNGSQTATDTFSYTASDGHGGTDTTTVTVTIEGRNTLEEIVQSFESPFFFGSDPSTTRGGTVSTVSSYTDASPLHTYSPTDGSTMVKLEATGATITSIQSFLGLTTGAIKAAFPEPDGSSPANSSAMKVTLDVHAGDQISFDWMFDARDYTTSPPDGNADNDFALLTITGVDGTNLYKLADVRQTGDLGTTGWRSSAYTAQHDGTLTIGFASINDRTAVPTSENSVLLIDNIRLNRDFDASYQLIQASDDHHLNTFMHLS